MLLFKHPFVPSGRRREKLGQESVNGLRGGGISLEHGNLLFARFETYLNYVSRLILGRFWLK